jgi:hypothetical protein
VRITHRVASDSDLEFAFNAGSATVSGYVARAGGQLTLTGQAA